MASRQKTRWTSEEDNKLIKSKNKYPNQSWPFIAKEAGMSRDGRSCWHRWKNYKRRDIYRGPFSQEHEDTIIRLRKEGKGWTFIGNQLQPQRTHNDVKNYWHNHLQKKLLSDLEGYLRTDDGTSDHSVRGDDHELLRDEFASLIPNDDTNASSSTKYTS